MRLVLDRRMQRVLRLLPRTTAYSAIELLLLALLGIQCARLLLVAVTPVEPLGAWRAAGGTPGAAPGVLAAIDPFFRLSAPAAGPAVVTTLNLTLYGVRADQATGRGSAIIGLPDGVQSSYAVGDEILPGVILKAVAIDSITVDRGGSEEQLFLDQSAPATNVTPNTATQAATPVPPPQTAPLAALSAEVAASPRIVAGRGVNGIVLQPRGAGAAFAAAGFQPGDVVVAINGQPVSSQDAAQRFAQQLAPGSNASVEVERGGQRLTLAIAVPQ
jgi:general secretion pathway protein C